MSATRLRELERTIQLLREANRRLQQEGPALERDKYIAALRTLIDAKDDALLLAAALVADLREHPVVPNGPDEAMNKEHLAIIIVDDLLVLSKLTTSREEMVRLLRDAAAERPPETMRQLALVLLESTGWRWDRDGATVSRSPEP